MSHRHKEFASPSILHDLSESSEDDYGNFKKHLSPNGGDNCESTEENTKIPQSKKRKNIPLSTPPARLKSKNLFARLPSNVPRLRKSRINQFCAEFQNDAEKQLESSPSLEYSPDHVTTRSRHNNASAGTLKDSSLRDKSIGKTNKRNDDSYEKIKQNHVDKERELTRNTKVNESEVQYEESVHALSDTAVDLFLQKFDQEMARDEVVVIDCDSSAAVEKEESFICKTAQKPKSSKRKDQAKAYNLPSTSKRSTRNASVSSDTGSISSNASNTSRYGRIRKNTSVYVQATMFPRSTKKPNEFKQKASSFINAHRCKNRTLSIFSRSPSFDESGNHKSHQTEILSPQRTKKSVLKKSTYQVTPTKSGNSKVRRSTPTGLIELRSPPQNLSGNSFHEAETERSHDECEDCVLKMNDFQELFKKPTNLPKCNRNDVDASHYTPKTSNKNVETRNLCDDVVLQVNDPEDVFKKPMNVSKRSRSGSTFSNIEKSPLVVLENALLNSPGKPVKVVKPSLQSIERDISMAGSSRSNVSQTTFHAVDDDFGGIFDGNRRKPDQSKIHAVVNDDVISLKWFTPQPNLDMELSNGINMHCSLPDFKQYFSTSSAGHLKIEAGGENSMQILKKCYMFYKIEKGEAVIRLPERTRVAQVGSMFFIPQGAEYTIRNSSGEEDLILLFVKMSPPT